MKSASSASSVGGYIGAVTTISCLLGTIQILRNDHEARRALSPRERR
jgi:hypothetical protein